METPYRATIGVWSDSTAVDSEEMVSLIVILVVSLAISFFCSMMEAALLTVPYAHVKHVADGGSSAGRRLLAFKDDIREPIAAILLLNTVSHTAGAALGGALVADVFGHQMVGIFSGVFTLLLLYLAEIPPKELGVLYCRQIGLAMALPLTILIKLMYPFIKASAYVGRLVGHGDETPSVSVAEVLSVAAIGSEEGVLDRLEGSVIKNVIGLDRRLVRDILTPRIVVFRVDENLKIGELREEIVTWNHTRVPIFHEDEPDRVERYVMQRDVLRSIIRGQDEISLKDLSRPMKNVPEFMRADQLLLQMFEQRDHICAVIDEHGGFAGIVTLEDVIEEIVGREIMDEYDLVGDLRAYAQSLYARKRKKQSWQQDK